MKSRSNKRKLFKEEIQRTSPVLIINNTIRIPLLLLLIYTVHQNAEAIIINMTTPSSVLNEPLLGNSALTESILNATISLVSIRQKILSDSNALLADDAIHNSDSQNPNEHGRSLKRVYLSNKTISCNDGSGAGFYLRKNPHSKKWIVFLEGGWHCFDTLSCRNRWMRLRHLMTSAQWPESRDVGGILSPLPEENPYWHSANHVLIPYCSSDSWSGTSHTVATKRRENEWNFMGALILRQVIADLVPLGLGRVSNSELLLVGSSAGGLGVMLNLDHVTKYLNHERNLMVIVRGVSDSGWFLDREPYTPAAIGSSEAVRQGWKLWQGLLPKTCTAQHPNEPWRCYFGYRLYSTLKSPLFVFQWLFDEAQMRADNVGAPVTPQQWNYIHEMGGALRSSLDNVTAVFAPSCIGHAVLSKRDWVHIKIDDISLPTALRCWEHSTRTCNRHNKLYGLTETTDEAGKPYHGPHPKQTYNGSGSMLTKVEMKERKRRRHGKLQKKRHEHKRKRNRKGKNSSDKYNGHSLGVNTVSNINHLYHNNNNNKTHSNSVITPSIGRKSAHRIINSRKQREHKKRTQAVRIQSLKEQSHPKKQIKRLSLNTSGNRQRISRLPRVPEKCSLRLLERCSWPQCNHSCPTLTNPLTGEEMRFLELLTSFGLDIEGVAAALGVDMHTLNNMERTELLNLLTQQVSK